MASLAARMPVLASSALAAAILAPACPLVAYLLPAGSGEGGFARFATHLAVAMAAVDLLMITWAGLAAASRRRRERAGWHLGAGLLALVAAMGLCLAPVYSVRPSNALIVASSVFGPAVVIAGSAAWLGRPRRGALARAPSDPARHEGF